MKHAEKPLRTNKTSIHKGKNKNGKCIYKALHTHSRPAVKTSHLPMWSSCYAHTPHQEHTTPKKKSVSAATFSRVRMWPFTTDFCVFARHVKKLWSLQTLLLKMFTPLHSTPFDHLDGVRRCSNCIKILRNIFHSRNISHICIRLKLQVCICICMEMKLCSNHFSLKGETFPAKGIELL